MLPEPLLSARLASYGNPLQLCPHRLLELPDLFQGGVGAAFRLAVEQHLTIQQDLKPAIVHRDYGDANILLELGPDFSGDPRRLREVASTEAVSNLHLHFA